MALTEKGDEVHVVFLPYLSPSHMIPLVNTARLIAARGVKATIITTKFNAALFQSSIDHDTTLGHQISVHIIPFPAAQVGLPEGIENFSATASLDALGKVYFAIDMLQKPMEEAIIGIGADCIMSDMMFPWTVDVTEKLNIPRFLFYPMNFLAHSVQYSLEKYAPHEVVTSDSEAFLVPGLPDRIEMKRSQLENYTSRMARFFAGIMKQVKESEIRSHGVVIDTASELEPEYANYYRKVRGENYWSVGPVFHFYLKEKEDSTTNDPKHECLSWLDSQDEKGVLFISFGSIMDFPEAQLNEIALALEASNNPFIWVVRTKNESEQQRPLPDGFEERITKSNRGLIIRNWAPQLEILNHPSVGGFMTHCGWNSILEALSAGVPLITWPIFAEQFYNEKLVEVLKVGVRSGTEHWNFGPIITSPLVERKQIEMAINRLMCESEESNEIRYNARKAAEKIKMAVAEGGSSYENLVDLVQEIKSFANGKTNI